MEKIKSTHEIVGVGENSAHYPDRLAFRKKRGTFADGGRNLPDHEYSSLDHTAGSFRFTNPFIVAGSPCLEIFSRDIKVKKL